MERHSLVPRANRLAHPVLEIRTRVRRHRNERRIRLHVEPSALKERRQLILNLIVPSLLPLHCRLVHLVNHTNKLGHPERLHKHDMLPRLSALLETRLELALARGDDEDRHVRLRSARDHGGHERFVSRGIEDRVSSRVGLEVASSDFDRFALETFLRRRVERPGEVPGLATGLLGLSLVFLHRTLVDHTSEVQEVPTHRTFTSIDMSDEDDVQMFFDYVYQIRNEII